MTKALGSTFLAFMLLNSASAFAGGSLPTERCTDFAPETTLNAKLTSKNPVVTIRPTVAEIQVSHCIDGGRAFQRRLVFLTFAPVGGGHRLEFSTDAVFVIESRDQNGQLVESMTTHPFRSTWKDALTMETWFYEHESFFQVLQSGGSVTVTASDNQGRASGTTVIKHR